MSEHTSLPDWVPRDFEESWNGLPPDKQDFKRIAVELLWRVDAQLTLDQQASLPAADPFGEPLQALLEAITRQAVDAKIAFLLGGSGEDRKELATRLAELGKRLAEIRTAAYGLPVIIQERLAELEGVETFELPELSDT